MTSDERDMAIAVRAEALYLINLLLVPGLAFIALLWTVHRNADAGELARCHLKQTVVASLWAGFLLAVVAVLIALLGGLYVPSTWVVLILYFTCCHAALILFGILGLSRALAGQLFVYPLIGSKKW